MLLDIDAVTNHIQSDSSWCATPISACCNELPLHQYILNASSNDIIELIVSSYPNAVHISDDGGNTPLHCACAVGSTEIIQLLLEYEAVPDICNHANETPLDILKSSCSRTLHSDVYKNITVLIQEKKEKNRIQELRNKRRRRREQIWNMTEEEAWFYAATNGSIPISIGGLNDDFQNVSDAKAETETETETDVHKVETKTANTTATHQSETKSEIKTKTKTTAKSFTKNKFTSMNNINLMQGIEMSGRQVIVELCQEDDFNALIRHPTSSKTALQLACISLHPDIVQALMNSCEISDIQNAVLLLEGIITSIVVERELSTLVMHQADAIRAPPPSSSRQKNKNMKKNGKMKKIKLQRGESKENYNQRKKKSKRKQWTSNESNESNNAMNLNAATDILRMLTGGKHMVFEEDRLRRKQVRYYSIFQKKDSCSSFSNKTLTTHFY